MTFEEGLQLLQKTFRDYIKTQVISKVDMQDLGYYIFFCLTTLTTYRRNIFYWTSSTKISRFRKNGSTSVEW